MPTAHGRLQSLLLLLYAPVLNILHWKWVHTQVETALLEK